MAKGDAADRLNKLRKLPNFAPVWSYHAEGERLPEYASLGLDLLSIERIVRTGRITTPEVNLDGQETVHVVGMIDDTRVEVVVCPKVVCGEEVAVIVTVKPK